MTMITKKELIEYLRSKNKELEDKLEAVKKHYEKIPVISMPFLTYEARARSSSGCRSIMQLPTNDWTSRPSISHAATLTF